MRFTIGYDKGIVEGAGRTTPKYAPFIGHAHGVPGGYHHQVKYVSGVHMPYSADLAL